MYKYEKPKWSKYFKAFRNHKVSQKEWDKIHIQSRNIAVILYTSHIFHLLKYKISVICAYKQILEKDEFKMISFSNKNEDLC